MLPPCNCAQASTLQSAKALHLHMQTPKQFLSRTLFLTYSATTCSGHADWPRGSSMATPRMTPPAIGEPAAVCCDDVKPASPLTCSKYQKGSSQKRHRHASRRRSDPAQAQRNWCPSQLFTKLRRLSTLLSCTLAKLTTAAHTRLQSGVRKRSFKPAYACRLQIPGASHAAWRTLRRFWQTMFAAAPAAAALMLPSASLVPQRNTSAPSELCSALALPACASGRTWR